MAEQVYFEDVNEGDEIPQLVKNCSTHQLVQWAAGSGDFYQIHYDKVFAQSTGLPAISVHGALQHASPGPPVHDWMGDGGRIKKFGCQYRGMDDAKQDIVCKGVISKKYQEDGQNLVELEVWTENPQGKKTSPGSAVVTLPSRG